MHCRTFLLFACLILFSINSAHALYSPKCSHVGASFKVTDKGLECSCGVVYGPEQVLFAITGMESNIHLTQCNTGAAVAVTEGESRFKWVYDFAGYLRALLAKYVLPAPPEVRSFLQNQSAEYKRVNEKAQRVAYSIPALHPNNLLQIYTALYPSEADGPEVTGQQITQAAQAAVIHFLILEPSIDLNMISDDQKVDYGIRLWLLVKLWMQILKKGITEISGAGLLASQAQDGASNYDLSINLQQLHLAITSSVSVPVEAQREGHTPSQWIARNAMTIPSSQARRFVWENIHLFIVAPRRRGGYYHIISQNMNVFHTGGGLSLSGLIEQILLSVAPPQQSEASAMPSVETSP